MTRHQSAGLASLRLLCPQHHKQQNLMSGVDSLHASPQTGRDKCQRRPGRSSPEKPCLSPGQQGQCSPGQRARGALPASIQLALGDKARWILASRNAPLGGCLKFEAPGTAGMRGSLMPRGHEACWASTPHSSIAMPPGSPADGC